MDNLINPNIAISAYKTGSTLGERSTTDGEGGVTFSDFLQHKTRESIDVMKQGEKMSAKAVIGEADTVDVVQAMTAAELTLQTVVSVRDRMIGAYQEIMRMPI